MRDGRSTRTKILFGEALERRGEERAAFLDDACAGSEELRGRVEALLGVAEMDDPFLRGPTLEAGVMETVGVGEEPGARIGPYQLLELIGEGGFGSVYLAEQEEPVRRRVALKIIRPGMDTRAVITRFERERQALAVMQHPNIAKVFDAGATAAGRPYFVMELVSGEPITQYCDENGLTVRERLGLFIQVCHGVQHAHSKGVIHRDIKPSNVLVTAEDSGPLARIIDFGIAKATGDRFSDGTAFTAARQLVGTLEYMSPEQAEGVLDIDTRADVYSLGVLLYELLTGVTPFDPRRLHAAGFAELQRIIGEDDPPKPSTRISHLTETLEVVASRRGVEGRSLARLMRGDLDWIVMRALEKDRARRYDTASALAEDVQRHLAGEVLAAAPPRTVYRLRRFVQRHRVMAGAASLAGSALVLGVIGTSIGLAEALRERDRAVAAVALANERLGEAERAKAEADAARAEAERSRRIATAVTEFFTHDVLDLKPAPGGAAEPTVRQLLDAVPERIDKYFKSDPAIEGAIRERVGQLYRRLGELERSREYLEDAIPLLEKGLGADHKQTLAAVQRLGELHVDEGRFARAAELFDRAYEGRQRVHGVAYPLTMNSLSRRGYARVCMGHSEQGLRDLQEALAHYQGREGKESRSVSITSLGLSDAYLRAGRAAEARALAQEVLETILVKQGKLAGLEWGARMTLGSACRVLGELDEALRQFDKVVEITEGIYPATHYEFVQIRRERGRVLGALGRHEEARGELEGAYSIAEAVFGADGVPSREVAGSLAALAEERGDHEEAARWRARE